MRWMQRSSGAIAALASLAACGPQPLEPPPVPARVSAQEPTQARDAGAEAGTIAKVARAPFVVAIVVDQLSSWVAASRLPELPKSGGFARLMAEGSWVKTMRYPYAVTDTAPGHASLHTGKVPAENGIFGNELPGPVGGHRVSIVRDASVHPVTSEGPQPGPGWSAARLRVDTVADRLRAARPDALIVSVSVKDRGAILPAGKHPSHVLWFDSVLDAFVTSTAFTNAYPRWAVGVGDRNAVLAARAKPWVLTDPAWVKAHAATPDDAPGEGDLDGMGTTFPHVGKTGNTFRALPAGDAMIADLALAAIAAEYDPARPTLLLLSFSASDIVGHLFGPDSWEAWEQLLELDAKLGALIDALDRSVGAPVQVLVAADHGNIAMPEVDPGKRLGCARDASIPLSTLTEYGWPCTRGERLGPTALRDELIVATRAALGAGSWIAGLADPYVYLTEAARALTADRRELLDKTIRTTLGKHKAIAEVFDARLLARGCPGWKLEVGGIPLRASAIHGTSSLLALVCNSWSEELGAGDYYVVPQPGSFFDGEVVIGKGTSHGTPYLYDRTVSMLVRAPGVIDAGAVVEGPVDFAVFAALEAAFVGLDTRAPREILAAHRAPPR